MSDVENNSHVDSKVKAIVALTFQYGTCLYLLQMSIKVLGFLFDILEGI